MPNKKYTDEHLEFVEKLVTRKKKPLLITPAVKEMCEHFELEYSDTVRRLFASKLQKKGVTENVKKIEDTEEFKKAKKKKVDKSKETFIIGWAQSETKVHTKLFDGIEALAKDRNAGIHIIAGRYKNPTSVETNKRITSNEKNKRQYWDERVIPYLDANRQQLHKYLQVLSDIKIQPTASTPLSGFNGITGLESCIIGHPRQHLKSLPVLEGYPHKLLLSTGACTVPNYTDTKAGKKGEFHHMLGFIIVELDRDDFHIRQVSADKDGNFYDLDTRVKDGVVYKNKEGADCVILGDVHVRHNDKQTTKVAFDFIKKMKPESVVIHDVAEMESILHWDLKDPFKLLEKEESGADNLEQEIDEIMKWLNKYKKYNLVLSRSNHDDMLDRWLMHTDWRKAKNKKMYLKLSNIIAEGGEKVRMKGILPTLIDREFDGQIKTLSLDDSYRVHDWELSMHGHLGANGSRGGHTQFKNLNTKNIVGHGHHPHREDGHIMVGTLSHLRVGFNRGPSNWMNGFGVIYPDGQAQLVHVINGKYTK